MKENSFQNELYQRFDVLSRIVIQKITNNEPYEQYYFDELIDMNKSFDDHKEKIINFQDIVDRFVKKYRFWTKKIYSAR